MATILGSQGWSFYTGLTVHIFARIRQVHWSFVILRDPRVIFLFQFVIGNSEKRVKTASQRNSEQPEDSTSFQSSTSKILNHDQTDVIEKRARELLNYTSNRLSHGEDEPISQFLEGLKKERHSLEKVVDAASEIPQPDVLTSVLNCVVANLTVISESDRNKSEKVKNLLFSEKGYIVRLHNLSKVK